MQPNRSQLQKIIEILSNSQAGVIALPTSPTPDAVAAACAMYLGLSQAGKNISIACQTPVQSALTASDKIVQSIATAGNDLVISFPYVEGTVDKVDYDIHDGRFDIIVSPRPGSDKVDPKSVQYGYVGGKVDFIVTFDAPSLRVLGDLYEQHQDVFKSAKLIVIDRHITNTFYGAANLVNRTVSSLSELTLGILHAMNIQIDGQIATNLYAGIMAATSNFSSPTVNVGTFEASAFLLKQGAQKPGTEKAQETKQSQEARGMVNTPPQQQPPRQMPTMQKSFERPGSVKPMNAIERDISHYEGADLGGQEGEDEWLKPDIFGSEDDVE